MGACMGSSGAVSPSQDPSKPDARPSAPSAASAKEEGLRNTMVSKEMAAEARKERRVKKLLLLGPGESGKSTFFKQMILGHGGGFEKIRGEYCFLVQKNVLEYLNILLDWTKEHQVDLGVELSPEAVEFLELLKSPKGPLEITEDVANLISSIWKEEAVQIAWKLHRSKIQVPESCGYFLDKVHEFAKDDYLPTDMDILMIRARTTGIVEEQFEVAGHPFTLVDVGGQKSERRKWVMVFDGITALIFMVPIGDYDHTAYEDAKLNRLQDGLKVWEEFVNMDTFKNKTILLFLNKEDLFRRKIEQGVPLTVCFPDYKGEHSFDACVSYIKEAFFDKVKGSSTVYSHLTCATDTSKTMAVFEAVRNSVIMEALEEAKL